MRNIRFGRRGRKARPVTTQLENRLRYKHPYDREGVSSAIKASARAPEVVTKFIPIEPGVYPHLTPYEHAEYMVIGEKGEAAGEESVLFTDTRPDASGKETEPSREFFARWRESKGIRPDGRSVGLLHAWAVSLLREPIHGEEKHFRLVVSPDIGVSAALFAARGSAKTRTLAAQEYGIRLMRAVEEDLQRKLYWAGASHWNTDHPHLHFCVRGVDRLGRLVEIPGAVRCAGFRARARLVAGEMLALRRITA